MDLDYVLCWLVGTSAGAGLVLFSLRRQTRRPGWLGVLAFLLAVLGLGLWLWPSRAGLVAVSLWLPLFFAPFLLARWVHRAVVQQNYGKARRLARIVAIAHPFDGWPRHARWLGHLEHIGSANREEVDRALDEIVRGGDAAMARSATWQRLRLDGRFSELRELLAAASVGAASADAAAVVLGLTDPAEQSFYVRVLGELGEADAMLDAAAALRAKNGALRPEVWLYAAAFTGDVPQVERLLAGPFRTHPPAVHDFWRATAHQTAGGAALAAPLLTALTGHDDELVRRPAALRLEHPLAPVDRDALSESARGLLTSIAREVAAEGRWGMAARRRPHWITWSLIAINVIAFAFEIPGGTTDARNLIELGALIVPRDNPQFEWWRIWTAGFLHAGWLHLCLNLIGLWYMARYVEWVWGRWRLVITYFAATFGANVIGVLLADGRPGIMLGASTGVMGVMGLLLASVAITWRRTRVHSLRRILVAFSLILALQTLFDLATPQVSFTLHSGGLLIGLALGALFAATDPPEHALNGRENGRQNDATPTRRRR